MHEHAVGREHRVRNLVRFAIMPRVRHCPSCGQETPDGNFCVRCGAPLRSGEAGSAPSRSRTQYAAAPHEPLLAPMLVSTLFLHLPRESMVGFRAALGGGAALVVVLAALGLFPVALIAAAMLLPILALRYAVDVDIYEDEPIWAMTLTFVWGALAGVAFGRWA